MTEETAVDMRKITRHELTKRMKRPVAVRKGLCLPMRFADRNERRLRIILHLGTFSIRSSFTISTVMSGFEFEV